MNFCAYVSTPCISVAEREIETSSKKNGSLNTAQQLEGMLSTCALDVSAPTLDFYLSDSCDGYVTCLFSTLCIVSIFLSLIFIDISGDDVGFINSLPLLSVSLGLPLVIAIVYFRIGAKIYRRQIPFFPYLFRLIAQFRFQYRQSYRGGSSATRDESNSGPSFELRPAYVSSSK